MTADGMLILAGSLAFAGNMKTAKGFPSNGYNTVGATIALVFLASLTKGTRIERVVYAFAVLVLISSAFYYVPILMPTDTTKRKKTHG